MNTPRRWLLPAALLVASLAVPGTATAASPAATGDELPGATIIAHVEDTWTGRPLGGACLRLVDPAARGVPTASKVYCGDDSGTIVVTTPEAGSWQLLAHHPGGGFGLQWVGHPDGTGDRDLARIVTTSASAPVEVPIYLSRAGTVTGYVRDGRTGLGVPGVCVFPYAVDTGPALLPVGPGCTDLRGRYTLRGLGPYRWPLLFASPVGYAWQWSGDAPHRYDATLVSVGSDATSRQDAVLAAEARITGPLSDAGGLPVPAFVAAYSAVTGDFAGPATGVDLLGTYLLANLAGQQVKIEYRIASSCWYLRATDFESATPVKVEAGRSLLLGLRDCT